MREAAELLAAKADWPPLYDLQMLAQSPVRTASATYYEVFLLPLDTLLCTLCTATGADIVRPLK